MKANLTCYRADCAGEFAYLGETTSSTLFRCEQCGAELSQTTAERVAENGDGYAAKLAQLLLQGGPE